MSDPQQIEQLAALVISVLCAVIFAGLGVLLIVQVILKRRKLSTTQGWASTLGQVIESGLDETVTVDLGADTPASYWPRVVYTYQVAGQTYKGTAVTVGTQKDYALKSGAEAVARRYPLGRQVRVYYNPQNPAEAALERSTPGLGWSLGCAALSLALAVCLGCGVVYTVALEYFGMPDPFGF